MTLTCLLTNVFGEHHLEVHVVLYQTSKKNCIKTIELVESMI